MSHPVAPLGRQVNILHDTLLVHMWSISERHLIVCQAISTRICQQSLVLMGLFVAGMALYTMSRTTCRLQCTSTSALPADPLPLEQMFYNRSNNPEAPDWIAVRGSSRMEGGHKYYHDSLPGTNYSADLGGAIFAMRMADASIKADARNGGAHAVSLDDAWEQHQKQQLLSSNGRLGYKLHTRLTSQNIPMRCLAQI